MNTRHKIYLISILSNGLKPVFLVCSLFLFEFSEGAVKQPYQQCKKSNTNYTRHVVKKAEEFNIFGQEENMEAGFCVLCDITDRENMQKISDISKAEYRSRIPSECFLAAALRGVNITPRNRSSYCSDKDFKNRNHTGRKKHCINEGYIDMISKAFSDMSYCFNLTMEDQISFFHLILHESGFILNARSRTDARCLGQVTKIYVKNINEIIKSVGSKRPKKYAYIYKNVLDRCPSLEKKTLPNLNYLSCKTTHDPYTCLFYTLFGFKQNFYEIFSHLNSPLNYMKNMNFTPKELGMIPLPLKLNEMLSVKGELRDKKVDWIFWDDSELYHTIRKLKKQNYTEEEILSLEFNKVPLFENSEDITTMLNYWAYNGGGLVARSFVPAIVKQLKQDIASKCRKNSKQRRCIFREKIQKGKSLSTKEMLSYFSRQIKRKYSGTRKRKKQVAEYVRKVANGVDFVFEKKKEKHFKEDFLSKNIPLSKKEKDIFLDHIQSVCPKALF